MTPFDLLVWDDPTASRVSDLEAGKTVGFWINVWDIDKANSLFNEILYLLGADGLLVESLPPVGDSSLPGGVEDFEEASWGQLKKVPGTAEEVIAPER